jgi:hypothetical protein
MTRRTLEQIDIDTAEVTADIASLLAHRWPGRVLEWSDEIDRLRKRRDKLWKERQAATAPLTTSQKYARR